MNKKYTIEFKEITSKDNHNKKKPEPKKSSFSWMILIFAIIVAVITSPVELDFTTNYLTPNQPNKTEIKPR